jgi:hypothetical protein
MDAKDWVAIYAAVLSTITATVQVTNLLRDRARLRLRTWWDSNDRPDAEYRHFIVSIANHGRRALRIVPPTVEIAQHRATLSRIYFRSPDEIAGDTDWYPLENMEPYEARELGETDAQAYRYEVHRNDKVLSVQVSDRAGLRRGRHRFFWSPVHRLVFYMRHGLWWLKKRDAKRRQKSTA